MRIIESLHFAAVLFTVSSMPEDHRRLFITGGAMSRGKNKGARGICCPGGIFFPAFVLLLALLFSGCRRMASPAKKASDAEKTVIGVSINSMRSPFMIALAQGIREGGEEEGVELILSDCNGDIQTQAAQIRDFVTRKVDGILIEPLDEEALIQAVDEASREGITVYCVDTTVRSKKISCTIGSDSVVMGQSAARYMAELLHERYGEYRGRVVDLMANVNTTSGRDRAKGFRQIISMYPEIEVVAEQNGALQLDTAMNTVTNILQANPDIDAIWCSGDTNAQGALQAMRRLGMLHPSGEEGHIILVSADGAAESLQAIREGTMDACISQNPLEMGRLAVQLLKAQITDDNEPPMSYMTYPLFVVTADTIDTEKHRKYGIWSEELP